MRANAEAIKWSEPDVVGSLTDKVLTQGLSIKPLTGCDINYVNALDDVMVSDEYLELTNRWLKCEIECCDARNKVNELLRARVYDLIEGLKK